MLLKLGSYDNKIIYFANVIQLSILEMLSLFSITTLLAGSFIEHLHYKIDCGYLLYIKLRQ
jgi:hypothetical protein